MPSLKYSFVEHCSIAQLVERRPLKAKVLGANPGGAVLVLWWNSRHGRPKNDCLRASGCKSRWDHPTNALVEVHHS